MMHEVADDDRMLSARADIDVAMAWRMARCSGQPKRIIELVIVVDKQCLTGRDHRFAVEPPHIAGRCIATFGRLFPCSVFALVEYVFGLREGRHPSAVSQHRVPAAMVNVQVRAEHVVDVLEPQTSRPEAVEPGLLWEVHRRRIALVLAGAGVDQDRVLGRSQDVGLISDYHAPGRRIENLRIEFCEMASASIRVIDGEHVLWPPPRPVSFDDARNSDVADLKRSHTVPTQYVVVWLSPGRLSPAGCCVRHSDQSAHFVAITAIDL